MASDMGYDKRLFERACGACHHYQEQAALSIGVGKCLWDGSTTTEVDRCEHYANPKVPPEGLVLRGISRDSDAESLVVIHLNRRATERELREIKTAITYILAAMPQFLEIDSQTPGAGAAHYGESRD